MQLPVLNVPKYLSPSALGEFELCEYKYYLKRLSGEPWPHIPQGRPAAVGSAFDSLVKAHLAENYMNLGSDPKFNADRLIEENVDKDLIPEVVPYARDLLRFYIKCGMLKSLVDLGITAVELDKHKNISVNDSDDIDNSDDIMIPVYGKPDAILSDGTIVDWKVRGAFSKNGTSPTPGYTKGYRGTTRLHRHAKADLPLEKLHERWAAQLAVYGWIYKGIEPFRDSPYVIDEITIRPSNVTATRLKGFISGEFQKKLFKRMSKSWQRINQGDIAQPTPKEKRCYSYNQLCEVSDRCEMFQNWKNMSDVEKAMSG